MHQDAIATVLGLYRCAAQLHVQMERFGKCCHADAEINAVRSGFHSFYKGCHCTLKAAGSVIVFVSWHSNLPYVHSRTHVIYVYNVVLFAPVLLHCCILVFPPTNRKYHPLQL